MKGFVTYVPYYFEIIIFKSDLQSINNFKGIHEKGL